MIQRIQTLWLALAAVCMALCFAFPVAAYTFEMESTGQVVNAQLDLVGKNGADTLQQLAAGEPVVEYAQRLTGMSTVALITLAACIILLAVLTIFLYKRRVTQMRIAGLAFLINVGYAFVVFFWAVDRYRELLMQGLGGAEPQVSWQAGAFLPLASLVFIFLAQRAIRSDEAKVRAADRLR